MGMKCPICGKKVDYTLDHPELKVYHMECAKNDPKMREVQERAQAANPHKVKKNANPE